MLSANTFLTSGLSRKIISEFTVFFQKQYVIILFQCIGKVSVTNNCENWHVQLSLLDIISYSQVCEDVFLITFINV